MSRSAGDQVLNKLVSPAVVFSDIANFLRQFLLYIKKDVRGMLTLR